jgi:hypothetical protein
VIDYGMIGLDGNNYGAINMGWDYSGDYSSVYKNVRLRTDHIYVRVGTGTGEVSSTDYSLFNDITDSLTDINISNNYIPTFDGYKQIVTISGTNSTTEEITITEAGITKRFYEHPVTGGEEAGLKAPVLLAKMVLTKPITVKAKDSFSLSIEWVEA